MTTKTTKTKKRLVLLPTKDGNGSAAVGPKGVNIQPLEVLRVALTIIGMTPLIQHRWSKKALEQIRATHAGKKTKNREARDIENEGQEAAYRTETGGYGIPLLAIKSACITAAHKDLGVEKTLVKKALFIPPVGKDGTDLVLPMECEEPVIGEDPVRVGQGSTDLRYRPYFKVWSCRFMAELDRKLLREEDYVSLLNRAGFGVGIGEWRPEKGGDFGRFRVDISETIDCTDYDL